MEKIFVVRFSGQLRGKKTGKLYQWTRKRPFKALAEDMEALNPMTYTTRPVGVHTTQADVTVSVPLRIESSVNGWHTLYKGDKKIFTSRNLDEVKERKAQYD